uniref:PID domain-containing protein n=1 Tax=Strix occidentalis caurina TaxID=311401 RepID=A0A8D0KQE9_STROC
MQSISFASGGDTDTTDYVAYVAKDPINQRACHILECCEGLAQSVISTVGQAFELRFKQYLPAPPDLGTSPSWGRSGSPHPCWDEEAAEHDYYNSIPGKEPPPGGLIDSRLQHGSILGHIRTQPSGSGPPSQVSPCGHSQRCRGGPRQVPPNALALSSPQGGFAARRDQSSQPGPPWDLESQGGYCRGGGTLGAVSRGGPHGSAPPGPAVMSGARRPAWRRVPAGGRPPPGAAGLRGAHVCEHTEPGRLGA